MDDRMRKVYSQELNERISPNLPEGYQLWQDIYIQWLTYGCYNQDMDTNQSTLVYNVLAAQLSWLVDLSSLVYDINWWLSCRVLALQTVVTGSISSGGDYGIHCWWDLIRSKQLSSVPVYRA